MLNREYSRITILETPYFSIKYWNAYKGHKHPDSFNLDDVKLHEQVDELNRRIALINEENRCAAPRFNTDSERARRKRGDTGYYTNWRLYKDGIHPRELLAKAWMYKLAFYTVSRTED